MIARLRLWPLTCVVLFALLPLARPGDQDEKPRPAADVERTDDACAGTGARADRQNQVADAKLAVVVDVGGRHAGDFRAEHGDVQPRVPAGDLSRDRPAVRGGQRHVAIGLDGVARGHDEARAPEDSSRRQARTAVHREERSGRPFHGAGQSIGEIDG